MSENSIENTEELIPVHIPEPESLKEASIGDFTLRHEALNAFKSVFRGYPFAGNTMIQALATEGVPDEAVIAAGIEQINAMLCSSPFDPEVYGFKMQSNDKMQHTYISMRDNDTIVILRKQSHLNTGMWTLLSRSSDGKRVYFPEFQIFLPNDMFGRIALTALGIIARKDLGVDDKGCPNDEDKDGICPTCESMGRCVGMDSKTAMITCPHCQGKKMMMGKFYNEEKCGRCWGKGVVEAIVGEESSEKCCGRCDGINDICICDRENTKQTIS